MAKNEAEDVLQGLLRRPREGNGAVPLFEVEPGWTKHWWGMPDFRQEDARATHRLVVNFETREDLEEFAAKLDIRVTPNTDTTWYPQRSVAQPREFEFSEPAGRQPRYPIYIPSKGRADRSLTALRLRAMGVPFRVVVEPCDVAPYTAALGAECLLVLPFENLGQGSIPARNWIWEHAKEHGHARHWVVDDNIRQFYRLYRNRRIPVSGSGIFRAVEDFVDRHENIAIAGFNNLAFAGDREPNIPPVAFNTRIYSMTLLDTALPHRWRGRYNEDTDLCLRVLKDGWCTAQFNAFLGDKGTTMTMKGGNTDTVYDTGDHRLEFARSLAEQHPDVATVTWKFNRWHHHVDYSRFRGNRPRLRPGVTPVATGDEYGMRLRRKGLR